MTDRHSVHPGRPIFAATAQREGLVCPELKRIPPNELARHMGRFAKAHRIERVETVLSDGRRVSGFTADIWQRFSFAWAYPEAAA